MVRIKAGKVKQGHTLTGLGYVVETEDNAGGYLSYPGYSTYSVAMSADTVLITMNGDDGEEIYLMLPEDTEVTVDSKKPHCVG